MCRVSCVVQVKVCGREGEREGKWTESAFTRPPLRQQLNYRDRSFDFDFDLGIGTVIVCPARSGIDVTTLTASSTTSLLTFDSSDAAAVFH